MIQEIKNEVEVTVTNTSNTEVNEEGIIENNGIVTISLPQSIINKIDENSIGDSMIFKAQAYFLCWLINRGDKMIGQKGFKSNTYQLHINATRKIISTKNQLEKVRDFLIKIEVIKCVSPYSVNAKLAKVYSLNSPFNYMNKANELIHFDTTVYSFAKNFKEANYLILPLNVAKKADKMFTTWENKEVKTVSQSVDNKELEELKEENRLMKVELEQLKQLIMQGKVKTTKEEINIVEPEKFEVPDLIGSDIEYNNVAELSQAIENDDDVMNKSLLIEDLEDLDFNEKVRSWDEEQAIKQAEENKIFDLNKYKNNLPADLTENVTNVIYRFTKSHQAVDKVIKLMNEGKTVEKSDMLSFGVSGAIVNQMYSAFQAVI